MASTYTPIATTTLGSAAASYTFSSIPSTYTDLVLVVNGILVSGGGASISLQFNADTASNYSNLYMYGDGTNATSGKNTGANKMSLGWISGAAQGNSIINIQNYSNTTNYKTGIGRGNTANDIVIARVGLWRNTSAISSILVGNDVSINFATGTTFTLYGIAAA
jgi:hypothetical protein